MESVSQTQIDSTTEGGVENFFGGGKVTHNLPPHLVARAKA